MEISRRFPGRHIPNYGPLDPNPNRRQTKRRKPAHVRRSSMTVEFAFFHASFEQFMPTGRYEYLSHCLFLRKPINGAYLQVLSV
jgi:hypothetical protein